MQVFGEGDYDYVGIKRFLEACPLLCEFNVEITFRSPDHDEFIEEAFELRRADLSRDDLELEKNFDWEYFQRVLAVSME